MIAGNVSEDGVPVISLVLAGQEWPAIVDTGFNGDLELPEALQGKLNDQPVGRLRSALVGGQVIEEDAFSVEFPFDDRAVHAIATFVPDSQILIGPTCCVTTICTSISSVGFYGLSVNNDSGVSLTDDESEEVSGANLKSSQSINSCADMAADYPAPRYA